MLKMKIIPFLILDVAVSEDHNIFAVEINRHGILGNIAVINSKRGAGKPLCPRFDCPKIF
jgi:hypothetical protein